MSIRIEKMIPAIRTQSLLRILDTFTKDKWLILNIKASASRYDFTKESQNTLDELGVNWHLNVPHSVFNLNYGAQFDDEGNLANPLDALAQRRIRDILEQVDKDTGDAAVTFVKVLLTNSEIQNYLKSEDDQFSLNFMAEEPHGLKDRNAFENLPFNKDLLKFSGFKIRIINCKYMVTRISELADKKSKIEYIIYWPTTSFRSLQTDNHVAMLVRQELDDVEPIGALKTYVEGTKRDVPELLDVM